MRDEDWLAIRGPKIEQHKQNRRDQVGDRQFYRGVWLESRYGEADEYPLMKAVIDTLGPTIREPVVSMFCDAKATQSFGVRTNQDSDLLPTLVHAALMHLNHGHNGICIEDDQTDKALAWIDPEWSENQRTIQI